MIEEKNKNEKILEVIKIFLENPEFSIIDVSRASGIPRSTVQRYLTSNEVKVIATPQISMYITDRLKRQKHEATVLGGVNSSKNNIFIKDQNGKFMGSVKK